MPSRLYLLLFVTFLVLGLGLGAGLQPQYRAIEQQNRQSDNFFSLLFGDSSRLFANNFSVKADAYYHSGYYPTIFDNKKGFQTLHVAEDTGAVASHNAGGDDTGFMGPPRNWVDAFGRHFIPNRHSHLDEGGPTADARTAEEVGEILPWLKFSAELDPHNADTFVVIAFWLRTKMNDNTNAIDVLRDGLRHNPRDPELFFELARVYLEHYADTDRARNILDAALQQVEPKIAGRTPDQMDFDDRFRYEKIQMKLSELEEYIHNYPAAIDHLQKVKAVSPAPVDIQRHIEQLRQKMAAPAATNTPPR